MESPSHPCRGSLGGARWYGFAAVAAACIGCLAVVESSRPAAPVAPFEGSGVQAGASLDTVAAWIEDIHLEPALAAIEQRLASESALSPDERSHWWRLRSRALRYSGAARSPQTLAAAERALELALVAGDLLTLAEARFDLGVLFLQRAQPQAAEEELRAALDLARSAQDAGRRQAAQALVHLAVLAGGGEGAERARELLDEAGALQELCLEPDHPEVAFRLTREANLASDQGELPRALELGQRALAAFRARLRADHPRIAMAQHNLGTYHLELRDLSSAARCLQAALELREADGRTPARTLATTRLTLAQVREDLGDLEAARELRLAAIGALEAEASPDDPYLIGARLALGAAALRERDLETARAHLARALASLEASPRGDALALSEARRLMGDLRYREGELEEAQRIRLAALADLAAASLGDRVEAEQLELSLGFAHFAAGELEAALARFERALASQRSRLPALHPKPASTLDLWAHAAWRAGRDDEAFERSLEAAELMQGHLASSAQNLTERDALGYVAERMPGLALALFLAGEAEQGLGTRTERAWGALIRARGLVFEELGLRRALTRSAADPELEAHVLALRAARERSAGLAWRLAARGQGDMQLERQLAAARDAALEAERAWIERSGALRGSPQGARIDLEDVRSALPLDWALVAYAHSPDVDGCVALVLGPGGSAPRTLDLGSAREIEALAAAARAECRRAGWEAEWRRLAEPLRARIWDPLAHLLEGAELILLVPDGGLHHLDFATLPVGEGDYLIDRAPPIHVLGAERDLVGWEGEPALLAAQGSESCAPGLLVLGAPAFGAATADTGSPGLGAAGQARRASFHALPESAREARAVAASWEGAAQPGLRARVLLGAEATERAFRELAPAARIVHLATHAFADGPSELLPAARGIGLPLLSEEPPALQPSGLSRRHLGRAALVFAGANSVPGADGGDDGLLTDEEIVGLDLDGLALAVLSACDSGTGEVQSGEGLFGLRRAFLLAGAQSVVGSLWPVEDRAASERMTDFHARLSDRAETVAEALRDASRAALERRRAAGLDAHPWYWAGFVVAGRPARVR